MHIGLLNNQGWRRSGPLVGVAVVAGAVGAAVLTGPQSSSIVQGVEQISSAGSAGLGFLATVLPLGYAFGAGMVAAVNPCGIALLPVYLGLFLAAQEGDLPHPAARLARGVQVSAAMTAGFLVLFGTAGLALGLAAATLVAVFPWAGLAVGLALIAVGAWSLRGGEMSSSFDEQIAGRLSAGVRQSGSRGYFVYGLAYGLASLSCTLPVFLTVVGSALAARGWLVAALEFLLYGFGMGAVITGLTLGVALAGATVTQRLRGIARYVQPASTLLLLIVGAYLVYYWLTIGGLLAQIHPV